MILNKTMKYKLKPRVQRRLSPVEKYVEFIIDASYSEQRDEIMWLVDNALKGNKKDVWDAITEIDQIK
jgi:hypothetical protein|tara:strand:- start:805 stop:1008 length:204 start_codon:yes stop_codon:yes gene_type:complete